MAVADPLNALVQSIAHIQHVAIMFLVLIVASVAVRMYVRLYMTKKFQLEDWAMVATFLLSVAHVTMAIVICQLSIGLLHGHAGWYKTNTHLLKASAVTYTITLVTLKISLGCFFLSIFTYQRLQRTTIYAIMVLSTLAGLAYFPLGGFTCAQIKAPPGAVCRAATQHAASALLVVFSVINIIGDFSFTVMAVGALWAANLSRATKVSTILLLCLGSTGGVASVVRLVLCLTPTNAANFTKVNLDLLKWVLIELGFSVVATNLALTRPLFHAILARIGLTSFSATVDSSRRGESFMLGNAKRQTQSSNRDESNLLTQSKGTATRSMLDEGTVA